MTADERSALVQRVSASSLLRSSPRLKELFLYIADCTLRDAPGEATEQQIGIHVFGRQAGYNSSEDSVVRSQARQLRMKLDAYFSGEGAAEPYVIHVPKGHYVLAFRRRANQIFEAPPTHSALGHDAAASLPVSPREEQRTGTVVRGAWWRRHPIALTAALLCCAALVALPLVRQWQSRLSPPERMVWAPFLDQEPPIVVFSNVAFSGDPGSGLHYSPAHQAGTEPVVDTYTGVGEVEAVHTLDRLFASQGRQFVLKRSHLVTWDEARARNLIFIGSPEENTSLKEIPSTTEFAFAGPGDTPKGWTGIVIRHPKPGEQTVYSRPDVFPISTDYAIVALVPGLSGKGWVLMLSGLSTYGTQAAVEYVTSPTGLAELSRALGTHGDDPVPFEALLQVRLGGGVPLQAKLVAVRRR